MGETCNFFESEIWNERLESIACRIWDLETFLRTTSDYEFDHDVFSRLSDHYPERTPDEVATASMDELLPLPSESELEIDAKAVRDAWRKENEEYLPENCTHDVSTANSELCLFHLSPDARREADISPATVNEALANQLCTEGKKAKQFVGCVFRELNLAEQKLVAEDNHPIDLRYTTIHDGVSFREAIVENDVLLQGAAFNTSDDNDRDGEVDADFGDHYVQFEGESDFMRARFRGDVDFKFVEFGGDTRFNNATFSGAAMFNYARFAARADFMGAHFDQKADFSTAAFEGEAILNGEYSGAAIFNYTTFQKAVDFWNTTFERKAEFWAAQFGGALDCRYAQFQGDARFTEARFEDRASFERAEFEYAARFKRVETTDEWIDLEEATIQAGVISQPDEGTAFFDLTRAIVGDVRLGEDTPSRDAFEYLKIDRTEFDKFDFAEYALALKPDWNLHTNDHPEVPDTRDWDLTALTDLDMLEQTYLRAKNGANDVGHNVAASQFFQKEMTYRRYQHWVRIFQGEPLDRAKSFWRWASNGLLSLTSGYGEQPRRTVGASALTVVVFAFFYWALPATPSYVGKYGEGYLLVSFQSFITFILGSAPIGATPPLQFVSAVEGFIGAFLIALLVFTLTRSIHR